MMWHELFTLLTIIFYAANISLEMYCDIKWNKWRHFCTIAKKKQDGDHHLFFFSWHFHLLNTHDIRTDFLLSIHIQLKTLICELISEIRNYTSFDFSAEGKFKAEHSVDC